MKKFHVTLRKIPTTTITKIIIIISIALHPYALALMLTNNANICSHSSQVCQMEKSRIISSWAVSVQFVSSPLTVFDKVPLRQQNCKFLLLCSLESEYEIAARRSEDVL